MRKRFIISLIVALFFSGHSLSAQEIIRNTSDVSVCYAGKKVNRVYIPPPKDFFIKKGSNGATIQVYYNGFTSVPKAAVKCAVSILSSVLPANAKFTIIANWVSMSDATVLGNSSITAFVRGSVIDALYPSVYYPVALAEKISGMSMNSDIEGDITLNINSQVTWYTGTDGNTQSTMYDLVTVALHELCHGIGFFDSFKSSNSIGSYGLNSLPFIYDIFIENLVGLKLTNEADFSNNSQELNSQLIGDQLYFNGPLLRNYTSGRRARIYTPSKWDAGSSISHLDEVHTAQIDALMTPFLDKGEAIHSPGELTLSILGDLGWLNTKIIHDPIRDTEKSLTEIAFKATIKSDTLFYSDSVGLVYSFNNFANTDTLYLLPPQTDDTFRISLSIPSYNLPVSYYFFVKDCFDRIYRLPSTGKAPPYKFYVGTDTVKPRLSHKPLDYFFDKTPSVTFTATADDNIGIDTVFIEYKKNNGTVKYLGLKNDSTDYFSGLLNLKPELILLDDSIQYRVVAIDSSSSGNRKYLPSSSYYVIHFEPTLSVVDSYVTDFTDVANDFINRGFSIKQPSQFTNPALHTKHPYESADKDGESLEYTAVLRHPVKVDETGIIISYQEIVLVEPGELGSVFGSDDFYDYVIVEGSKDFGKSWFWFEKGYDSRISSVFESDYNSFFNGQNSTFIGSQDMYIKHTIDIRTLTSFAKGDSLLIRFRLYSDPYAHGWGWAIDDLSIKSVAAGVPAVYASDFNVYPNPGNGHIKIDPGETASGLQMIYYVLNTAGIRIQEGKVNTGSEKAIDISNQPPGLYLIVLKTDNKIRTVKYSLIKE